MRRHRTSGRAGVLAAACTLALVTGCSAESAALDEAVSTAMTTSVVDVAEAASAGELDTAVATLDELQQQLDDAIAGDDVTADRAVRIQRALDVVRADLEAISAAASDPSVEPDATQAPVETQTPEETETPAETQPPEDTEAPAEVPTQAPVVPEADVPVVTPEVQPPGTDTGPPAGPGEKGKGKDKGKGKNDG